MEILEFTVSFIISEAELFHASAVGFFVIGSVAILVDIRNTEPSAVDMTLVFYAGYENAGFMGRGLRCRICDVIPVNSIAVVTCLTELESKNTIKRYTGTNSINTFNVGRCIFRCISTVITGRCDDCNTAIYGFPDQFIEDSRIRGIFQTCGNIDVIRIQIDCIFYSRGNIRKRTASVITECFYRDERHVSAITADDFSHLSTMTENVIVTVGCQVHFNISKIAVYTGVNENYKLALIVHICGVRVVNTRLCIGCNSLIRLYLNNFFLRRRCFLRFLRLGVLFCGWCFCISSIFCRGLRGFVFLGLCFLSRCCIFRLAFFRRLFFWSRRVFAFTFAEF